MPALFTRLVRGGAVVAMLSVVGFGVGVPTRVTAAPLAGSALWLGVDKPIAHLGETIQLSGQRFTSGATVRVYLHGPYAAMPGRLAGTVVVGASGRFVARVRLSGYPDGQARWWHTVDMVALSSARLANGAQEGAMVPVQVDPMPGVTMVERGALATVSLVIDGDEVPAQVARLDATHTRVSYAGHLRAGLHSGYLKWRTVEGSYGARVWNFRIGSPYAVPVSPRLSPDATRVRLGKSVIVRGQGWTRGATVTARVGGPNTAPGSVVGWATADAYGRFVMRLRMTRYPDANARQTGIVYVDARASGPEIGDLPEGVAVPLTVTQ